MFSSQNSTSAILNVLNTNQSALSSVKNLLQHHQNEINQLIALIDEVSQTNLATKKSIQHSKDSKNVSINIKISSSNPELTPFIAQIQEIFKDDKEATVSIDNEVPEQATQIIENKKTINTEKALINVQVTYNLINAFAKSTYTSSVLITEIGGLEGTILGLSPYAIGASIPIAILFALAEAYAHHAESEHFNHATHDHNDQNEHDKPTPLPLNWKQKIATGLHYLSDTYEGAAIPLLFAKLAGVDQAATLTRIGVYSGSLLFSAAGNAQELVNTKIAFQQKNARDEQKLSKRPNPF